MDELPEVLVWIAFEILDCVALLADLRISIVEPFWPLE
jgi:hypothetical protein